MDLLLVTMPWAALDTPSLALGILQVAARDAGATVHTRYANLDFFDWAAQTLGLDTEVYDQLATHSYFEGHGDWVFSAVLHDRPHHRVAEFLRHAEDLDQRQRDLAVELHRRSDDFLDDLADGIAASGPAVVGLTTTFQQNTASLALARRLKARAPEITIVFGGANCDGRQGAALHRNFPYVDYVVRGEGDRALPLLLEVIGGTGDPAGVPGLCWRDRDGASRANPQARVPLPAHQLPDPEFTAYFDRLEHSAVRHHIEPKLVLEGSRGCWWGEKHHCTFCGLNGSLMQFRSKDAERFLREILDQARRHHLLDVVAVDNILDMGFLQTLLPALGDHDYDLRIHYEIKSNLSYRQLRLLAEAGLVQVQPGVESLSTRVLKLMDKGVTGCQNVRHLRDAQSAGIWVSWNYLYGFPGEHENDYHQVIDQLPALHHLVPPEAVTRLAIERFSPYFDQPDLGFSEPRPAGHYARVYDLPEAELHDLAYLFDAAPAGIAEPTVERLHQAVAQWRAAHDSGRFTHCDLGHKIVLVSRRPGFDWSVHTIHDPVELAAFRLLADPRSVASLARRLTAQVGATVTESRVERLLADWREAGIVYHDADRWVHVATLATNGELTRLAHRSPGLVPAGVAPGSAPAGTGITLHRWRDYHGRAGRLPGMDLGRIRITGNAAAEVAELYRSGVRRVALVETTDLTAQADPATAVLALELVRELTAWGVVVDWRLHLDPGGPPAALTHLHPPAEIVGAATEQRLSWVDGFFLGRLSYRQGPGFLEIRDHREGVLNRIIVDDPAYLDAIGRLVRDPAARVSAPILSELAAESLILAVGDRHWWAPYRPRRWPQPPFQV
ncbi:RiPP maturation radical SAM C-methyltransferase [Micromonospora sp. NPDC048871]|uniref:RiPP maturation radical SAM C-methyltransferase n=1 Tax=unclassified Micromonospora TaxID=2617518 RepID=UPI002E0E647C|nr:RiPP maturation radical SAM C-methyltransferase [Micromonospora sp. NBC_01739]